MIHLRLRTEYSFEQTYAPVARVIARLKELGCTAAGIVDSGTWGHVRWFNACKEAGIQPLLGVEVVVSDGEETTRMWFLARSEAGLRETYTLTSKSHRQTILTRRGRVPRLYRHDVEGMSEEIIKFAGDVTDGPWLASVGALLDLNPASRVLNAKKLALAKQHGLRLVSTADNSYAKEEDRDVFELTVFGGLKPSPQHIIGELEHQDVAAAIAAECSGLTLPKAPIIRAEGDLEALCREGIKFRNMSWNDAYEKRLQYELELIHSKDFVSYFLVVGDMVRYAKQHMLVGPSRGSSAGSLVCYLTRITEIDPIPPKLYFERFIDVSRSDLPDIDIDFPDNKRHMVFEYMTEKYGVANTAHIGTISTFKPRSALIQVCKALNIPSQATGAVKVAMIERGIADSRAQNCLEDTLLTTEPGKALLKSYPQVIKAAALEGHATHSGVHAAGLLVCNDAITNYCTVDGNGIAHVEKGAAESLGLLKIDVLGLRTLGILEDSGVPINWYGMKFDDPAVYDVFNNGKLSCIFQFEGQALRSLSKNIKFETMTEIDAVTALARPGPFGAGIVQEYLDRKRGKTYEAIHPLVQARMADTCGLPLYQEQTLAIVRDIGKFDWAETSFVRKAISKRLGKEFFGKFWPKFLEGARSQGIDEQAAHKVWDLINSMGAWQMNKAHTYSYAVISYWTAYLKAHHPLEFAAANLRSAKDESSATELLREMHAEGIHYKPFDLELSEENWAAKDGMLIGGFLNLKGFGEVKARKYVQLRNEGKLTAKQKEEIAAAENPFNDIFPLQTAYGHLYADPRGNGIAADKIWKIAEMDESQFGNYVFIAEIVAKNSRNENEEVNVKRREARGKPRMLTGPVEFLDLRVQDDTGAMLIRVNRFDYERIGRELSEQVELGAHLLLRVEMCKGLRFGYIKRWKRLDKSE